MATTTGTGKLYNLYIFNRNGKCLFYREWNRPLNTLADDPDEEKKLVFGMLYSLKDLATKLSPSPATEGLHTVKTNSYTLHHFQSASGLVFVLNSSPEVPDLYQLLQHIYSHIYIDCVVCNPLYKHHPDEPIECPLFSNKLEEAMSQSFAR